MIRNEKKDSIVFLHGIFEMIPIILQAQLIKIYSRWRVEMLFHIGQLVYVADAEGNSKLEQMLLCEPAPAGF